MLVKSEKVLYVIGGANGAGKSTLAEELFGKKPEIKSVNADDIARDKECSQTSTTVCRVLLKEIDKALSASASFIYETTLSGKFDYELIERVKAAGYSIELFYVTVSTPDDNIKRVGHRVESGGHNVRQDDILRRRKKSLCHFEPVCAQVNHWRLYDNTEYGAPHKLVAEGTPQASGEQQITIFNQDLYAGFMQYKQSEVQLYMAEVERARTARKARIQNSQTK
jgi:predicted ABC-type ATPase